MMWWFASSMRKLIRSFEFILFGVVPVRALAHSVAVIVWRVGQYDAGKDDMIKVFKWVSDHVKPISIRFLCRQIIRSKCCFNLTRWAFESVLSESFMLVNCSSASNRYRVLLVVTLASIASHISFEDFRFFSLLDKHVNVDDISTCCAMYSFCSNLSNLASFDSICSSVALVFPSESTATLFTTLYGFGTIVVPKTCHHNPFEPMALSILDL